MVWWNTDAPRKQCQHNRRRKVSQQFSNGAHHIRLECADCGLFIRYYREPKCKDCQNPIAPKYIRCYECNVKWNRGNPFDKCLITDSD